MSADAAEGGHAQQGTATMNEPAGRNRTAARPISRSTAAATMVPLPAGLMRSQVAVFNGVRHDGGPVPDAEEISPLPVSVLRIAVRQAHTSNALIPRCPTLH